MKITERVWAFAEPVVQAHGCRLWDVEYVREGGEWFLRLYIDKDGGVNINDCEAISRDMDPILDREDPIEGSYRFEVCSAGLERPLKRPSDFEAFLGADVLVKLYRPVNGIREYPCVLRGYDNGDITVEYGTLTVKNIEIIALMNVQIIANSDEKPFDGTPLTNSGFTTKYLPDGYTVTAEVSGSQTVIGESENTITNYQIYDENHQPVSNPPGQNVTVVPGTLKVKQANVVLNLCYGRTVEQNEWETSYPWVFLNGTRAPRILEDAGTSFGFRLFNDDRFDVIVSPPPLDSPPGEYQIAFNWGITSLTPEIYSVTPADYMLTIVAPGTLTNNDDG